MTWLADLRHQYPGCFRTLVAVLTMALLLAGFLAVPRTELFTTLGVTAAQDRLLAMKEAAYWQARAWTHPSGDEERPPAVLYGHILGIDTDARVIASIPDGGSYQTRYFALADLVVTDLQGTAVVLAQHHLAPARFDLYGDTQVVIWINREPVNVKLIEAQLARPIPNPATNIIDLAFARYYWTLAKGGNP